MKRYPLKFLDSYTKNDTDIFFGREEEVDTLYEMIFQTDILLLYGASGTGKTSLIQCGLASRFESHDWLDLYVRRGANINESLENALQKAGGTVEAEETDWIDIDFEEEGEEDATKPVLSNLEQQLQNIYLTAFRPLYLIFDQFEELYILGTEAEQEEFIQNVKMILALNQPVKMIFSIREEYLGYLYDFERDVPQLLKKKLRIEPMNLTKIQEVIAGTTTYQDSNITIKKGEIKSFTEAVFNRLQGNENNDKKAKRLTIDLPYLQVFLDKIYMEITKDRSRVTEAEFSLAALKNIGKIDDVLREFLEEQVILISQQLKGKHRNFSPEVIWQILSPFVTLEGTKEPITAAVITKKINDTIEADSEVLTQDLTAALIKSKIIRYLENEAAYEIAHDALALKIADKRSDEEIALLEVKRLIKSQAVINQEARETFTEKQLNFIEPYLEKLDLDEVELGLIEESRAKITAAKAAQAQQLKAAQTQAEKDRKLREKAEKASKRATQFTRIAVAVAAVAIVVGIFAWQQSNIAKTALETAKIEKNNALIAQINAEISDSSAQIEKVNAIQSDSLATIDRDNAKQKEGLAKTAEQKAKGALAKAKEQEELAKAAEQKAITALDRIALTETKSGLTALEQFEFEEALEHLKNVAASNNTKVKTNVKNTMTDFVIVGLYRISPQKWETELQPLFAAFQQTASGIEVHFDENKGTSILLDDFEKARQKALNGDKKLARKELIQAMQQKIDKKLVIRIMEKYAIPK